MEKLGFHKPTVYQIKTILSPFHTPFVHNVWKTRVGSVNLIVQMKIMQKVMTQKESTVCISLLPRFSLGGHDMKLARTIN